MSPVTFKARKPFRVDPGVYGPAILKSIEQIDSKNGPCMKWTFDTPIKGKPTNITLVTSDSIGAKSKARPYVQVLLGRQLGAEETLESSSLIGKRARLVISDVTLDDGTIVSRVQSLLPVE